MSRSGHLQLIPFNPNDYSVGELLNRETAEKVETPENISAVFSLAFQFPDHALTLVCGSDATVLFVGELGYDTEERELSELYLSNSSGNEFPEEILEGARVTIRLEIFRQCYEFSTEILAVFENERMVVRPPTSILGIRDRKMPRVRLKPEDLKKFPKVSVSGGDSNEEHEAICLEIGLRSILIKCDSLKAESVQYLLLSGQKIRIQIARSSSKGETAFYFQPDDHIQYGAIFEAYRLFAFPHLRLREEFRPDQILELYTEKTGYLGKFQEDSDSKERIGLIQENWTSLRKDQHRVSADYVTVDQSGELAGASSAVLAFKRNEKPIWAFHQLCARASPDILEQSGQLYTWRAEYLAGRKEDLDVVVWFDSKSRWLERIYVKFALQNQTKVQLHAVFVARTFYSGKAVALVKSQKSDVYGNHLRLFLDSENEFGAVSPTYLNAAGGLNAVIALDGGATAQSVISIADGLIANSEEKECFVEITLPAEKAYFLEGLNFEPIKEASRFCIFNKDSLVGFLGSVEHSVAVTARKKAATANHG